MAGRSLTLDGTEVRRPPGPPGSSLLAALATPRGTSLAGFFTRTAQRYPRLAHLAVGGEHVYVLSAPDLVRDVLVTHGRSTMKSRGLQATRRVLGNGLLTSEGDQHREQRRLVQPAFNESRVRGYADAMLAAARMREQHWSDGAVVDMAAEMSALTLDVVGRTLVGTDLRAETEAVAAALDHALRGFRRAMLPGGDLLLRLPLPGSRRAVAAAQQLDDVVRRIVADRRATHGSAAGRPDVLSVLLSSGMDDRQIRDQVMTLVLAGHETTAQALAWTWALLDSAPDIAAAVAHEVHAVGGDGAVSYEHIGQLPATTASIAEAMRLYPPAWILGRRLTADVELDGWSLLAGSLCLASQWVLHRDPRCWTDASSFRPQRWLDATGRFDESAPGQPRGAWFPFGMGARVCIGERFAWTEAVLVLAALAPRWAPVTRPTTRAGRSGPRPLRRPVRPAITLRPAGGLPMLLRRR